jgi:hypothetical protein
MARTTKSDVRAAATRIVQYYAARLSIEPDAPVRRGKLDHIDPKLDPEQGWWVDCRVFVGKDELNDAS